MPNRIFKSASFLLSGLALTSCLLFSTPSASAQNLLSDGGFEDPAIPSGTLARFYNGQNIGGWSVVGTGNHNGFNADILLFQSNYGEPSLGISNFSSEEGLNNIDLTGDNNQGVASGVNQTVPTSIGQTYNLSFYVGRASGGNFYATPATVDLSINNGTRVEYTNSNVTPGTVNWKQFTTSFVATSANTTIAFFNGETTNNYTGLDNVVLLRSNAVPAPSALLTAVDRRISGLLASAPLSSEVDCRLERFPVTKGGERKRLRSLFVWPTLW